MLPVRIHGRGGQGVTGAEMLSVAAFFHGRHAQAFPASVRHGWVRPVVAYWRIESSYVSGVKAGR